MAVLPDIQETVWQEQYEIFHNSTRDPTFTDVKKMEYLSRFVLMPFKIFGLEVNEVLMKEIKKLKLTYFNLVETLWVHDDEKCSDTFIFQKQSK